MTKMNILTLSPGKAHTILEDGQDLIGTPGDAQLIEAGEGHINYNNGDEAAVVVWMLVERIETKYKGEMYEKNN